MTENSGGSWLIIKTDNSQQVFLGGSRDTTEVREESLWRAMGMKQ